MACGRSRLVRLWAEAVEPKETGRTAGVRDSKKD